jgi:hypothetical protein
MANRDGHGLTVDARRQGTWPGPWPTVVAATLATIGVGLVVMSMLVWTSQGLPLLPQSFNRTPLGVVPNQVMAVVYIVVGALLGHRAPRNPVGWLLLVTGLVLAPVLATALIVAQTLETYRPTSDVARLSAWFVSSLSTPTALGCLALAGLLFPDGRLPSRRLRWVVVIVVGTALLFAVATAFDPVGLVWYPTVANPFAAPSALAPAFEIGRTVSPIAMLMALGVVIASIVLRYRSGDAVTRAQLRWIMFATLIVGLSMVPFLITRHVLAVSDAAGNVVAALANLGMAALPIAAAFAITRYRLFGIDRLISRTLVYVPLVGILGGLYAAAVALFQRLFVAVTGEPSDAPLLIAVFLIAAAFTPVRKAMEGAVDRWARAGQLAAAGCGTAVARPSEPTAALGEPISAIPTAVGPDDTRVTEGARSSATMAAVRRLEARLTAGGSAIAPGRVAVTLPIGADGTVDCPAGPGVPFTTCLGCPYLVSVGTSPPEIRCWRRDPGESVPA